MGKTQDGGLSALLPLLLSSPWRSCRTKRESHHHCSAENEKERLWLLFWLCSVGQWEKSMTGVTKYLWKGYFFTSKLPESQERLKSDLIFCFMVSFFMSSKKHPEDCACVYCLPMISQEPCTSWAQMEHSVLNYFPSLHQCASCVQGSRKGGTRAGLYQLHVAWKDVDSFHFCVLSECKERRTGQINCPDIFAVAVWLILNLGTVG